MMNTQKYSDSRQDFSFTLYHSFYQVSYLIKVSTEYFSFDHILSESDQKFANKLSFLKINHSGKVLSTDTHVFVHVGVSCYTGNIYFLKTYILKRTVKRLNRNKER